MSKRSGNPFVRLLLMVAVVLLIVGGIYYALIHIRHSVRCADNLRTIYQALELFEMDRGALPTLAVFPEEPMVDPDSIRVVLEEYGVPSEAWVCPSSHPKVARLGLSYIWNPELNQSNLRGMDEPVWMLIEINALSSDVPAPHYSGYNVLYTDGTVERIADPEELLLGF